MGLDETEFAVCSVPSEICLKLSNSSSFSKAEEQQITSNLSHKIICFRSGGWLELLISRRPNVFYQLLVISYVSVIHLKTSTLRCIDFFA